MAKEKNEMPESTTQKIELFHQILLVMVDTNSIFIVCEGGVVGVDGVDLIYDRNLNLKGFVLKNKGAS